MMIEDNEEKQLDLFHAVKSCQIFTHLSDKEIRSLLQLMETVKLKAGDTLFSQGDFSQNAYIIVSGKLAAIAPSTSGNDKLIGHIVPYEIVGEISLLANVPRTLSVKAKTDALLLMITQEDFKSFSKKSPTILIKCSSKIVKRSQALIDLFSKPKAKKCIAILPANSSVNLTPFFGTLKKQAPNGPLISILDSEKLRLINTHELLNYLNIVARQSDFVIYPIDVPLTFSLAKALRQFADKIVVVAASHGQKQIDAPVKELLTQNPLELESKNELVLLHPKEETLFQNTRLWLSQAQFFRHHHIRQENAADFKRFIRFMTGKAVGLVLSGGGSKGLAHIGALKALEEKNIAIDAIVGTSVGASIGIGHIFLKQAGTEFEKFSRMQQKGIRHAIHSVSFKHLTLPLVSLFNNRQLTLYIKGLYRDNTLEDLVIPSVCIACNVTQKKEELLTEGKIWEMIRASISIPGLWPPVVKNGNILVDGGVINNFPVDVMRKFLESEGTIIGLLLKPSVLKKDKSYNFPPTISLKEALAMKLGFKSRYCAPNLIQTFLNAMHIGSFSKQQANKKLTDLLVELILPSSNILSPITSAQEWIAVGYHETMKALESSSLTLPTNPLP